MSDEFVHFHLHDTYSAYDGVGLPEEFAERCAELGQPGLAQTNHGSLRGLFAGFEAAKKHGIKFIPGIEAYLADDISLRGLTPAEKAEIKATHDRKASAEMDRLLADPFRDDLEPVGTDLPRLAAEGAAAEIKAAQRARRERDHITLWAINDAGLKNLYRLNARAWSDGFFHKPRVDMRLLRQHADGVAASTGCPGGVVTTPIRFGNMRLAVERAAELAGIFGDRLYCELMPHVPTDGDPDYARKLLRVAERVGAKVIATQDAHFPFERDTHAQEVFLCIQRKEHIDDPNRGRFDGAGFWMTTRNETAAMLREHQPWLRENQIQAALDETLSFFERCTAKPHVGAPGSFLQGPPLPEGYSRYQDWLKDLAAAAFEGRGFGDKYHQRLLHELGIIAERGFAEYILMVWELRAWARQNGVTCGPGRGSGAGSLVCWLLGITGVDPVRHGLLFERFIDPNRPDYPDIDLDSDPEGADRVVDHLRELYGEDRVVGIATHGMLGGRGTLRDLARVYRVSDKAVEPVIALIPDARDEESKSDTSLGDVLRGTAPGREFAAEYPDVVAAVDRLEGNMRSAGSHPGGVIISSVPVVDVAPVESRSDGKGRVPLLAYDMRVAEKIGFVKLDNLRLLTLEMLALFRERTGLDVETLANLEDQRVIGAFTARLFAGVFQFDTAPMRRLCRGFEFNTFDDVAVLNALNRPGPKKSGLSGNFIDCYMGRTEPETVHPLWDAIFLETYGVPVYQEQIIRLVVDMCGYSIKEATAFRIKVSKSKGLADEYERFIDGAKSNDVDADTADRIFNLVVGAGSYLFNKCLDERTKVFTARGAIQIRDVAAGDTVLSSAGPRKVIRTCVNLKAGVRLRLADGREVTASGDHRFFRPSGEPVHVRDLKHGDEIGVVRQAGLFGRVVCPQGPIQGASLQCTLQADEEVWPILPPGRAGLLEQGPHQEFGRSACKDGKRSNRGEEAETRSCNKALAAERIVAIEFVGLRRMVDIEVEEPHDFFLANGILSHNSHSYAYATLAWWMMTAKVLDPGEFYLAALEVENDKNARLRLAAEARRSGIPVTPPAITFPRGGVRQTSGGHEIVVPITELKGIGRAAGSEANANVPTDLRGLGALRGRRFTGRAFSALARANGLRDVIPHHRFASVNAKEIWRRLQKGQVPELRPGVLPDYSPSERSRVVAEVWPLFVDSDGATVLDRKADELRARSFRQIDLLEEEGDDAAGLRLVAARFIAARLYPDPKTGNMSGRLALSSADGVELNPRIDADVADRCAAAFVRSGEHVLCALWRGERGGYSVEGVWSLDEPPAWLLEERRSKPADPMLAVRNAGDGGSFRGLGLTVLRRRDGRDKNGKPMVVFDLLGTKTTVRGYVFAYVFRRLKTCPRDVEIGDVANVSGVVLGGGAVRITALEKR